MTNRSDSHLRNVGEFLAVYKKGKRFEGSLMTVFVMPNRFARHRLGVTATRRTLGKAVQRNRAKRLLREAFRLEREHLQQLSHCYDWVLRAKNPLVSKKVSAPQSELNAFLSRIASAELDQK